MTTAATCDTSVLVAALVSWHPRHADARRAVGDQVDAIPAHVLIESYSVLTRLPAPHRLAPGVVADILGRLTFRVLTLPPAAHVALIARLASGGVRGGSTYDGLVAATARHHRRTLLTLDRRARGSYDAVGVVTLAL
ncbi:type II toxin-antitoxin system VapC family toxin [Nocardioides sp. InS609-2]|uniref:type II toxin-antitoxin system VapC family toxin n=1 Tax=Nocardioides sp. InS609-2 TaxID=2760705 RepID=UPI0020BF9E7B|nr:type II toxin-antitoxin system VapC family toxin [Nocardioides sp. InS609-2]